MTLAEAAQFLRKSKSWLYQNRDVPRHRPPGSRGYLFDRDELLEWVKSGQERAITGLGEDEKVAIDRKIGGVYHWNSRYR